MESVLGIYTHWSHLKIYIKKKMDACITLSNPEFIGMRLWPGHLGAFKPFQVILICHKV